MTGQAGLVEIRLAEIGLAKGPNVGFRRFCGERRREILGIFVLDNEIFVGEIFDWA